MAVLFHSRQVYSVSFFDLGRAVAPRRICRTSVHRRPPAQRSEQCRYFGVGAVSPQRSSKPRQSSIATIDPDSFSADDLHIPFDQLQLSHSTTSDILLPASNQYLPPLSPLQEINPEALPNDSASTLHDYGVTASSWRGRQSTSGFEAELAIIGSVEEPARSYQDSIRPSCTQSPESLEISSSKKRKRGIRSSPSRRIRALRLDKFREQFRERTNRRDDGETSDTAETNPKPIKNLVTKDASLRAEKDKWQIDKSALRMKFGGDAWNPKRRLSPDALEGIRTLHAQHPEEFTTPVLAEHFKISPEAVRRILKSKWRPSNDEEQARRERWDRRGEKIWTTLVDQGVHPPKKWREMGIGGGPRRVAQGTSDHGQRHRRGGPDVVHEDQATSQLSSSSAWVRSLARRLG